MERCLPPADRFVLLYLSAHVARWRDAAPSPRAQRVLSAAGGALREAAWAWQTHAYVVWPPAARLSRSGPSARWACNLGQPRVISADLAQERIHSPVDVYVSCFAEEKRIAALVADPPVAALRSPCADCERRLFTPLRVSRWPSNGTRMPTATSCTRASRRRRWRASLDLGWSVGALGVGHSLRGR